MIDLPAIARRCGLPLTENGQAIYVGPGDARFVVWGPPEDDTLALTGPRVVVEKLAAARLAFPVHHLAAVMTATLPARRLLDALAVLRSSGRDSCRQ